MKSLSNVSYIAESHDFHVKVMFLSGRTEFFKQLQNLEMDECTFKESKFLKQF